MFRNGRHLSLSQASYIKPLHSKSKSVGPILILFSLVRPGKRRRLFPSGFCTKSPYIHLSQTWHMRCLFLFFTLKIFGQQYKSWTCNSTLSQSAIISKYSQTASSHFSRSILETKFYSHQKDRQNYITTVLQSVHLWTADGDTKDHG